MNQYVGVAEDKVRRVMDGLNRIGYSRGRIVDTPFFKTQLGSQPKPGKSPLDDYFELVNYYVETAVKVIDHLTTLLQTKTAELAASKAEFKPVVLEQIQILAKLQNSALPQVQTLFLLDQLIQSKFEKYTLDTFRKYLSGPDLHDDVNEAFRKWPILYAEVDKFVAAKRIMHEYGDMKKRFAKFRHVEASDIPADKFKQFTEAAELFESFKDNFAIVDQAQIGSPSQYSAIADRYIAAREDVANILLYLQGGVSEAFLILRNTNDVDRRHSPNKDKLLKAEKDKDLVYIDRVDDEHPEHHVLGTAMNKFKKVFHGKPEQQHEINNAILSEKNYNLLKNGGTVIIIAYGQSGTGKTYTLTKLIEHFSTQQAFELIGVSSVQFYNDVMLPGGKHRLTVPLLPDPNLPTEAAARAVYKSGQLNGLPRMDPKFNKTKMYDVGELSGVKLKIEPVVSPMPRLPENSEDKMVVMQKFSTQCFHAATTVNELANSNPKLNRLFETYKQMVIDDQNDRKLSVINDAYRKYGLNEFFLPIYSLTNVAFRVWTMNQLIEFNKDITVFCSKYGMKSFSGHFQISQIDVENLLTITRKNPEFNKRMYSAVQLCIKSDTKQEQKKLEDQAGDLIKNYETFLTMRRAVYMLADAEVNFFQRDTALFQVGQHFFSYSHLVENVATQAFGLEITKSDDPEKILLGMKANLVDKDYPKYDNRGGIPYILHFTRPGTTDYVTMRSWGEDQPFEIYFGPNDLNKMKNYDNHFDYPYLESVNEYNLLKKIMKQDLLNLVLSDIKEGDTDSIEWDVAYDQDTWFQRVGATAVKLAKKVLGKKITIEFTVTDESKTEWKKVDLPKSGVPYTDLKKWEAQNVNGGITPVANTDDWETNPDAYRAKFEHHLQISKTGPDNESNYALFDHAELRYKNYFKDWADEIEAAYTDSYQTSVRELNEEQTLKELYDDINKARFTRAMPQNPESSRSQLATTLYLRNPTTDVESRLIFIDLAGNEKVDTTKKHIVTCESVYINSTLKFVTDMFLRMKEEYPGWEVDTADGKLSYKNRLTQMQQFDPPREDQLVRFEPAEKADPFQKFLYEMSTVESKGLKPAIVMVVCAYEYYSSWIPPNPSPDVSKESLKKTFEFISALFSFADPIAAIEEVVDDTTEQEVDTRTGGRITRKRRIKARKTKSKRIRKKSKTHGTKKKHEREIHLMHDQHDEM